MKTWEPTRPGEQLRGKWRKAQVFPGGVTYYDLIETDSGIVFSMPKDDMLRARLKALDPSDGDDVVITFNGKGYQVVLES
jgi:hypothetical protein